MPSPACRGSPGDLMLATSASKPFDRPGWIFELNYEGFRVLAIRDRNGARLCSRRGTDLSARFPEIMASLIELSFSAVAVSGSSPWVHNLSTGATRLGADAVPDLVLDGELVVPDDTGKPSLERLRRRLLLKRRVLVEHAARHEPAALFAFDILCLRGRDLRTLALVKRKIILRIALEASKRIQAVQHVEEGQRLYDAACGLGVEGIVAKRGDAPYKAGRSPDWVKIRTPMTSRK